MAVAHMNWFKINEQLFCPVSRFGKSNGVKMLRDHTTGFIKDYAFVSFDNATDAAQAVKYMNKCIFEGHMLAVKVAQGTSVSYSTAAPKINASPTALPGIPGPLSSEAQASTINIMAKKNWFSSSISVISVAICVLK
ncbi:conserved hypothetical protein [Ricinus communis]|uniref:RRM domain-containing protein n=1 Tax=Ricinus communis TaxID=3988 RepID=B9R9C9_RICCO|nr:conserved hypothetical protein [Ricinus communis]